MFEEYDDVPDDDESTPDNFLHYSKKGEPAMKPTDPNSRPFKQRAKKKITPELEELAELVKARRKQNEAPPAAPPNSAAAPGRPRRAAQLVPLDKIEPNQKNPRQEAADLPGLAASLDQLDLLNPIQVRPNGAPGKFVIVAGERRFRAAQLAGWKEIPAVVRDDVDDAAAAVIMAAENLHQSPLNTIERARSVQLLLDPKPQGGAGLDSKEAAAMFKKSASWVANLVRLLALPDEWQQRVATGELKENQARALVPYVKRPEILAAVAEDMRANPNDWTRDHFDCNLANVVASLDGLPKPEELRVFNGESAAAADSRGGARADLAGVSTEMPLPAPVVARRAPATLSPAKADAALVAQIVPLVGQVATLEALDKLTEAIHARGVVLRK